MRRLSVRRSGGALGAALIGAGLALGFAVGFLARGLVGGVDRRRLRTLMEEVTGDFPPGAPTPRQAAGRITAALAADERLGDTAFDVVPVSAGHVELHGWVDSRAAGARAMRLAGGAVPDVEVTNRLQVRGEDDTPSAPDDARQPA